MAAFDANFYPAIIAGQLADSSSVRQIGANFIFDAGDSIAPVVTVVSPSVGTPLAPTTPLVVDVTDEGQLREVVLVAKMNTQSTWELVYDGTNFAPNYLDSSRSTIFGGYRYSIARRGGWPAGSTVSIEVHAIDTGGNEAS